MQEHIRIKGAREHNLKDVSLELPRNKMICITGLSGSGKSSLAFDTIFAEGQRRYVESLSAYARQFLGQLQKPDVDEIEGLSPAISIDQKAHSRNPRSTVATITEVYDYLRVLYARIGQPHCVVCQKPIQKLTVDEMVDVIVSESKGEKVMLLGPAVRGRKGEYYQLLYDLYNSGFAKVRVDGKIHNLSEQITLSRYGKHTIEVVVDTLTAAEMKKVSKETRQRISEGIETCLEYGKDVMTVLFGGKRERLLSSKFSCPDDEFSFPEIEPRLFSFNSPYGACPGCDGLGIESLFSESVCPVCNGKRLRPEGLHVWVGGKSIVEVTRMNIDDAQAFLSHIKLNAQSAKIAENILREINNRLQFMLNVGIEYLTLDRRAGTLSGGEAQRIRLASQIGSRLVGAMYVLDEPTIGLHQRDNDKLIATLLELRDMGNTIIVVEHDEDTILAADWMVELGPGAGIHGGHLIVSADMAEAINHPTSLTAAYLRGDLDIPVPEDRRAIGRDVIKIRGASANNLKNIDVDIPLRRFVCVTGVSGSGKSTLVEDVMYKHLAKKLQGTGGRPGKATAVLGTEYLDRVEMIDQSPIGRTPRSNPATYTGAWTPIRELLASVEEARYRGYKPGRFSFNTPGGRCENCQGNGQIGIEMHFLPTVYVPCDVCHGKRFDRETLEVLWNGKNVHQILELTIDEGVDFFKDVPIVHDRMLGMQSVGLGYITIGQPATTLSGGEAQRVKLAKELSKRHLGRVMYVFDEPTTGLHFADIKQLLEVMHRLVEKGNTVVVIEHNLDVIKTADWVIDLGPEGGDRGGTLLAEGTPEEIARMPRSYTGQYLKKTLKKSKK
ncbi:excinuclease ABC subunit A [Candidatus Uhrbacteria bacterium CG10_big_fil_rev_8_21_14_0_10_50_16]|uniref:UvrABC system protein A n=1 Tax=Candidatus Uhrbacteria bacterium CG10_big_fil_rev_8_21_14_0_10_50_16 TaxID=1975039 RepID=A0A2H0RLJ3_9BACT|nr:MAG: excinuclease ABC subunit A [Candidatus Uhrbacteria bacterium CG10_big_fil_rev_8_21_14_0_10_50_16]